jgi:uncharacterized protein YbjT (DUF2867 family)
MRLFVLGATGRTGHETVEQALRRGHDVTAFVRSPDKVKPRERLRIVAGSALDTEALKAALPGHDAVLSALGPPASEGRKRSTLMTDFAASTVAAMTTAGVSRLLVVSAAMLFPKKSPPYLFIRWLLRNHVADLRTMEAVVAASPLDWTLARPPRLVARDRSGYRARRDGMPPFGFTIAFSTVASFLLDAVERREWIRQTVGVSQ